ncbi:S1 family peptidase [Amycolatopsis anabasis]|uniref:S1 family peptidase n=1 Tax=Amycolatopsis anabasis TaxID=1840409 RepID=UPI00131C5363|nr:S1 family peptidase [Amycolatopsis anabasis]
MNVYKFAGAAVAAATIGALFTGVTPAGAESDFSALNPGMVTALQRDLGLTHDQALAQLASETRASTLEQTLEGRLGNAFGGAFYDARGGKLRVGVTDAAQLDQVRASGADAFLARFSERQLDAAVDRLNAAEASLPSSVTSWGVDTANNRVTVTVTPGQRDAANSLLSGYGLGAVATVVESAEQPRPRYDVRGGDAYYIANRGRCSVGFSVQGGFVTAGHCAQIGNSIAGFNRVAMGSFGTYRFPGSDYARANTNSNWTPRGVINNGTRVAGSTEAAVGASACKSGSTTGWTCGTIQAKNQTVRYAEGTVYGMTKTNIRSDSGDSGGSVIAGNQAQGLLSGGSPGTMFFQPVNPALQATGARLVIG